MPDRTIGQIMQGHADDAVRYARARFRRDLDFGVASLDEVDRLLSVMYFDVPRTFWQRLKSRLSGHQRTDEELWTQAKMWGGYVGEVIRRHWGGTWRSSLQPDGSARISLEVGGLRCYPGDEVRRRLVEGKPNGAPDLLKLLSRELNLSPMTPASRPPIHGETP